GQTEEIVAAGICRQVKPWKDLQRERGRSTESIKRVETISEAAEAAGPSSRFFRRQQYIINLVQRLPDQLHHDIMVLLGEGHYAERTAKQTIEILNRRGKALEVQVESVKALIQDLKAEASFFDATASESAEGLVEIRESIVKPELPIPSEAEDVPRVEDEEYDRILSRLAELEKEEEEAENANREELGGAGSDVSPGHVILEEETKSSEVEGSKATSKDFIVPENSLPGNLAHGKFKLSENAPMELQAKEDVKAPVIAENKADAGPSEPRFDSSKAFTCSIIEHTRDVNSREQSDSRSSKPVSRFKMQRK
ncbi:hypothetical protein HAX54_003890, partial [Datura stramonium]|nr:hypothetical protein [Datura stramonium]